MGTDFFSRNDRLDGMKSRLTGWGNTAPGSTTTINFSEMNQGIWSEKGTVIARGFGRSYGDASYTSGGTTVQMTGFDSSELDFATGTVLAEAGTSIEQLISRYLPLGYFVPVTPGTRFVSVGGAIAADIHGKNHHRHGTFGMSVSSMTIQTPIGTFCTSDSELRELHWATIGGMGLTGFITDAQIKMQVVETSKVAVDTYRTSNIHDLMQKMRLLDEEKSYSVAWIDTLSSGDSLGRSVLTAGEHATVSQLPKREQDMPLTVSQVQRLSMPSWVPSKVLNKHTVSIFNELWFRKAPKSRQNELQTISKFFHPLDGVTSWNNIYGRNGFVQYQFVVPDSSEDFVVTALEKFSKNQCPIFLAVLKRFGEKNQGMLSFPSKGWTLAIDVAADFPNLQHILNELDDELVARDGKIYLAKDSRMNSRHLTQMYPLSKEFKKIRSRFDPNGVIQSNLSRRLNI